MLERDTECSHFRCLLLYEKLPRDNSNKLLTASGPTTPGLGFRV